MNLTSPSQVKAWCIANGFHPNKVLGQNFLIDRNALVAIVDAGLEGVGEGARLETRDTSVEGARRESRDANVDAAPSPRRNEARLRVLEIGPGLGVLTEELLARGCEVVAIEKDPVLAERLAREAQSRAELEASWKNLTVVAGDALDFASRVSSLASSPASPASRLASSPASRDSRLASSPASRDSRLASSPASRDSRLASSPASRDSRLASSPASRDSRLASFDAMVSNLPYQAGTRILLDLVVGREIPAMTVLVQTEVAERLAAREGSKMRSLAGVWAQLDYDVKIVRRVAATCFWPRPEIGSSVVRLARHGRNADFGPAERKLFHRLTKQAFEHRRKQLGSIFKDMIQSSARAEELSNEDWTNLVKGLMQNEQDT